MASRKEILIHTLLLGVSILLFAYTDIDTQIEDLFYNFQTHRWLLDRDLQPYKLIFYDGIKKVLILFAVAVLLSLLLFRKKRAVLAYRKGLLIVLFSALLIPSTVSFLKKVTNMPCPKNEIRYGGCLIKTKVWEPYPPSATPHKRICCWPAGHASGGFALLSLLFLFRTERNKKIALYSALGVGWSMGLYKMVIGDHFFSHTVISMQLSWILVMLIARTVDAKMIQTNQIPTSA